MLDDLANLPALVADVQAGGGGSFGSGGGSSGGGGFSGDGDGLGYLFYFLIRLAIEAPLIGVPLLIVAVVIAVASARKGKHRVQERVIRRARPARREAASRASARTLAKADPGFDERAFLGRVERAFHTAQNAWCAQELEPLRAFVSDGVYERFSLQIEEQIQDGWRQGMEGTRTGALGIAHVERGAQFETVTVRIPFQADIHRLDRASGKRIPGSRIPRGSFAECWSFVRRRGASTPDAGGLIEGQCPNCGARLRVGQSAKCGSCAALVRSGEFDWVLAEITQASEWAPEREADVPGMARYVTRDPGMSVQLLEDRASVAFWREAAAQYAGDVAPLSRVATPELCEEYEASQLAASDGARRYVGDRAVGAVRTLGVLAGEELDRAVVEVVWDGRMARVDAAGRRTLEEKRRLRSTLLVLGRAAGQQTRVAETFTTTFCRTCGAHDAGGTDPSCPYCGAPRTGDRSTWLVHELVGERLPERRALLEEIAALERGPSYPVDTPLPSATGLLAWAVQLVRADGEVDARERRALGRFAQRMELEPRRVDQLLARDELGTPAPTDPGVARQWLRALVELALDDGHLSRDEQRFLRAAAGALKVERRELTRMENSVRSQLFRESRTARRETRLAR